MAIYDTLYDTLKAQMIKLGIEEPDRFLVRPSTRVEYNIMCCKVAGNTTAPPPPSAEMLAMQQELELQQFKYAQALAQRAQLGRYDQNTDTLSLANGYVLTRKAIEDNLYKGEMGPIPEPVPEPKPAPVWCAPHDPPELDLGEVSAIAEMDVLMQEPREEMAPDLILD